MTRILSLFGLMRVSEHEARVDETRILTGSRNHWRSRALEAEGRFKRAATDLEKQAGEIARLEADRDRWRKDCLAIIEEADALRPDAEAMRKKRAADRKRMAGKRGKA